MFWRISAIRDIGNLHRYELQVAAAANLRRRAAARRTSQVLRRLDGSLVAARVAVDDERHMFEVESRVFDPSSLGHQLERKPERLLDHTSERSYRHVHRLDARNAQSRRSVARQIDQRAGDR
jgi:hypothetical protein